MINRYAVILVQIVRLQFTIKKEKMMETTSVKTLSIDEKNQFLKKMPGMVDVEALVENFYVLECIKGFKTFFELQQETESLFIGNFYGNFQSYERINEDSYLLKNQGDSFKGIFKRTNRHMSPWCTSYKEIGKDLYIINDIFQEDTDIILNMLTSEAFILPSSVKEHRKMSDDLHLFIMNNNEEIFVKPYIMDSSDIFTSSKEINKDLFLLYDDITEQWAFFQPSSMETSIWFGSYRFIEEDLYLLNDIVPGITDEDIDEELTKKIIIEQRIESKFKNKAFFKPSNMKVSLPINEEKIKIGDKIYIISKAGSKAELDKETLMLGLFQFTE